MLTAVDDPLAFTQHAIGTHPHTTTFGGRKKIHACPFERRTICKMLSLIVNSLNGFYPFPGSAGPVAKSCSDPQLAPIFIKSLRRA